MNVPLLSHLTRVGTALAGVATLLALVACHDAPAPIAEPPAPTVQGQQLRYAVGHPHLALLSTAPAQAAKPIVVELPARLVWNEERTQRLYPAFAGRVTRIAADVGQSVKPGSVLAQVASPEFGTAQAEAARAQADAGLAQKALARQRELFDAGVVARKELEQAEADAARTQAELQRAQARTRLYGGAASVDQTLALVAGIGGVVVERNLTPGQELRPDQMGSAPPPFVISDPTVLWVQIDAREADLASLRTGTNFELVVPALAGQAFKGRIAASSDFVDPTTRTIKVRGVVPNPNRELKAEMLATARFARPVPAGSVVVPAAAIALRGNVHTVMVQVAPGAFEPRDVKVADLGPREAVISQGLEAGEQVVSDNVLLLLRQLNVSTINTAVQTAASAPASPLAPAPAAASSAPAGAASR